jgi:hypothetical protein
MASSNHAIAGEVVFSSGERIKSPPVHKVRIKSRRTPRWSSRRPGTLASDRQRTQLARSFRRRPVRKSYLAAAPILPTALADPMVRSRLTDLGWQIFPREHRTLARGAYRVTEGRNREVPIIKAAGIKAE